MGNWIGVIYASEKRRRHTGSFAGPGGPFRLNIEAGPWFEMVHRGAGFGSENDSRPYGFCLLGPLWDFSEPPDKIIMHRNNASGKRKFSSEPKELHNGRYQRCRK